MLTLPIKKKWYDMILTGEKKEEYREIKDFYKGRLGGLAGRYPERNQIPERLFPQSTFLHSEMHHEDRSRES